MSVAPASAPTPGPAGAPSDPAIHHAPRVDRSMLVVMLVLGLAALVIGLVWTRDLFPMTEVRGWLRGPWPVDWERYLLLPKLAYGDSRLTSVAVIQTVGRVCGLDTGCVNAAGSGLVALAVMLLVGHTWQLLRSVPLTIPVAVLWLLSAPVLNVWMWQSTWSDLVAFLSLMVVSTFWWWWFGRPDVSRAGTVAFVLASLALLAVAFNSKELLWVLVGVMPLLAVVRSRPGTLRRNLLVCVIPLAWAIWYIGYALTHLDPGYAAVVGSGSIPTGLVHLVRQALGIDDQFMSLGPPGGQPTHLHGTIVDLYLLFLIGFAGAIGWYVWRHRGRRTPVAGSRRGRLLAAGRAWALELYLLALVVATTLVAARSTGGNAYYMLIPWWAALTLVVTVLRRVHALPVLALLAAAVLVGWVALMQPLAVASSLLEESRRLEETGATIKALLHDRDVTTVKWRAEGPPWADFYLIRDNRKPPPGWHAGSEIWETLTRTWGVVTLDDLGEGTAAQIMADVGRYADPGEVVVVLDEAYRLELLAHEGTLLYVAPKVLAPPPAASSGPSVATPAPSPVH